MEKMVLQVEGMSCDHCKKSVEKALREIGADGTVDLKSKSVEVIYDPAAVDLGKIREAIEDQGYEVVR